MKPCRLPKFVAIVLAFFAPDGAALPGNEHVKALQPVGTPVPKNPPVRFKRTRVLNAEGAVKFLEFSPDANLVAGEQRGPDGVQEVAIWDVTNGATVRRFPAGHPFAAPASAVFIPPGDRIATISGRGTVRVWAVATGNLLATLDAGIGPDDCIRTRIVAFPDGRRVVCSAWDRLIILDLKTGSREVRHIDTYIPKGEIARAFDHPDLRLPCNCPNFTLDGTRLATHVGSGSSDPKILIWDAKTLGISCAISAIGSPVLAPDGRTVAAVRTSSITDGRFGVAVWKPATGEKLLDGEMTSPRGGVAYTRDSAYLLVCDQPEGPPFLNPQQGLSGGLPVVGVWEIATGRLVNRISGVSILEPGIAVSPDNKLVAVPGRTIYKIEYAEPAKGK